MAKISYKNKSTGKVYTTDSEGVKRIKSNPVLANAFTFEAEEAKPSEPKTASVAKKSEEEK